MDIALLFLRRWCRGLALGFSFGSRRNLRVHHLQTMIPSDRAFAPVLAGVEEQRAGKTLLTSLIVVFLIGKIALDHRRSQKLLDPFRFIESLVDSKTDFRCKF